MGAHLGDPRLVEFVEPAGALPDPNTVEQSFVPTPSPSPLEPEPGAWPATELSADVGANISDVAGGGGRLVAVGAGFPDGHPAAAIWTSTDGRSWEPVVDLPDGAGIGLNTVDWNGEIYLASGHREEVPAEGETSRARGRRSGSQSMASLGIRRRHRTRGRDRRRRESRTPRSTPAADGLLAVRSRTWPRTSSGPHSSSARTVPTGRRSSSTTSAPEASAPSWCCRTEVCWPSAASRRVGQTPASSARRVISAVAIRRWHRVDARRDQRPVRGGDDAMGRPPHRHRERGRPDAADGPDEQTGDVARRCRRGRTSRASRRELGRRTRSR